MDAIKTKLLLPNELLGFINSGLVIFAVFFLGLLFLIGAFLENSQALLGLSTTCFLSIFSTRFFKDECRHSRGAP